MSLLAVLAVLAISAVGATAASAACYKVSEAKTGTFKDPNCMIAEAKGEYIKVSKLEKEVPAGSGIWCAKVEEPKTGTFKNAACTEAEAKGEFIKVSVFPFWGVSDTELAAAAKEKITGTSGVSRLWSTGLSIVIVCKKDVVTGGELIGGRPGTDKATSVTFTECTLWEAVKNATSKKWEVGKQLTACTVGSPSKPGEIVTKELKSTLAYYPGTAKTYTVDYFEPVAQPFVSIEVAGALCAIKETVPVEGSVIAGTFPHENIELPTNYLGFTVHENAKGEMVNTPEEYEKANGEKVKDTLEFGKKPTGYESLVTVELTSGKNFVAHT